MHTSTPSRSRLDSPLEQITERSIKEGLWHSVLAFLYCPQSQQQKWTTRVEHFIMKVSFAACVFGVVAQHISTIYATGSCGVAGEFTDKVTLPGHKHRQNITLIRRRSSTTSGQQELSHLSWALRCQRPTMGSITPWSTSM